MECTGYTAYLSETGNQSFRDFAMGCARAFFIQMRDTNGELPNKFVVSSYHAEELRKAKEELAHLEKMTPKQRVTFGERQKRGIIRSCRRGIEVTEKKNLRIQRMVDKVKTWNPPAQHEELKQFMLQQLNISFDDSTYTQRELKRASRRSPSSLWSNARTSAKNDIEYHARKYQEDVLSTERDNQWLADLRKALK